MPTLDEFDFLNTFPCGTLSPMIGFEIGNRIAKRD